MISYLEIKKRDRNAAALLLLLARFDNRDIWYKLVESGRHCSDMPVWLEEALLLESRDHTFSRYQNTIVLLLYLSPPLQDLLSGLAFKVSVKTLIRFSLLESKQQEKSYAMHPVVQDWCHHLASTDENVNSIQLNELALISVGYTVPSSCERHYSALQQRLIPHANYVRYGDLSDDDVALWGALHNLGTLYSDQGKLNEAEEMYQRALAGCEKALGPDHTSTLDTVNNLSILYASHGKLKDAEEMYQRALAGKEKALGPDHTSTLDTVHKLGTLYKNQGKLNEAGEMYQRALAGYKKALGPDHTSTLDTVHNLGTLYSDQGKLNEAEEMYQRALPDSQKVANSSANRARRAIEKIKGWRRQ
ncbi:unnamed protein product [Penicillium nalgiovense]|uniref:TPR-like protein n=1 Tax=Penicillium nalgiovense TaxID=60175 RepID=A0A9W4HK26_PENNA|nr:unnamed protein product [Penicillium nalgiovense]CAG7977064.1 unnamed protein product [Penicillium nalgiovense]CAG8006213.1 unnamed protein product [Penicillium nalgiovense]CAG8011371.1 unnamed protein product [Penicillium nalgiovense]CAG8014022.1 unnamed protein product [Penicillium nalgiovense]